MNLLRLPDQTTSTASLWAVHRSTVSARWYDVSASATGMANPAWWLATTDRRARILPSAGVGIQC